MMRARLSPHMDALRALARKLAKAWDDLGSTRHARRRAAELAARPAPARNSTDDRQWSRIAAMTL